MDDPTQIDSGDQTWEAMQEFHKGNLEPADALIADPTFRPEALRQIACDDRQAGEGGLRIILLYYLLLTRRDYAGALDFTKELIAALSAAEIDPRDKLITFYEHRATLLWFSAEHGRDDALTEASTLLLGAGLALDPSSYVDAEKSLFSRIPREGITGRKSDEGEHPGSG